MLSFIILLSLTVNASEVIQKNPNHTPTKILETLMESPQLGVVYTQAQMSLLRTDTDVIMHNALNNNPILEKVIPLLETLATDSIKDAINEGLLDMHEATDTVYSEIRKMTVDTARSFGYSEKQIKNMRVYVAPGAINAYTMAFSKDQSVVVVFTGLNNSASPAKLKSVIGHELGHIVSEHVLQRIKMVAMNMLLMKLFVDNEAGDVSQFENLRASNREKNKNAMDIYWKRAFETLELDEKPQASAQVNSIQKLKRNLFIKAFEQMSQELDAAAEKNPEFANSLINDYLDAVITCLERMEVPERIVDFYISLKINLDNPALKIDANFFTEHLLLTLAAMSREQETSSDRFGLTVPGITAKDAAAMFLDFAGAEQKAELDNLIKAAQAAVNEFYTKNPEAKRLEIIGGNARASHPNAKIRALNDIYYGRSVDIIAIKNPFLRLIVLHDEISRQENSIRLGLKSMNEEFSKLDMKLQNQISDHIKTKQSGLQTSMTDLATTRMYLSFAIVKSINETSDIDKNQYLRDALDFYLAQKQVLLNQRTHELKIIKSVKKKAQILQGYQSRLTALKENPLVLAIGLGLEKNKNLNAKPEILGSVVEKLLLITQPNTTLPVVVAARENLRQLIPVVDQAYEDLTISQNPPIESATSGMADRYEKPVKKSPPQAPVAKDQTLKKLKKFDLGFSHCAIKLKALK
ncbi:MAG: M48 family metalloprotease [Oligoflexia bacterium]|nr:M48 family metalloprotease [Oligoflexia bacterium]